MGKIGGALTDGFGGVNVPAIDLAFRLYEVQVSEQVVIFERIMAFLSEKRSAESKE